MLRLSPMEVSAVRSRREVIVLGIPPLRKINNSDKYGIESLALFGSFSRNEQKAGSDVDILVSLKRPSLYLYAALKNDLESILSREVDIISAKSKLREEFKQSISKELIYV